MIAHQVSRDQPQRLATEIEELQFLVLDFGVYLAPERSSTGVSVDGIIGRGFLGPIQSNAYGPGMNSDATGRPLYWRSDFGGPALGPITPNAYGPGIGMDGTWRPVRPSCPPGMVMC